MCSMTWCRLRLAKVQSRHRQSVPILSYLASISASSMDCRKAEAVRGGGSENSVNHQSCGVGLFGSGFFSPAPASAPIKSRLSTKLSKFFSTNTPSFILLFSNICFLIYLYSLYSMLERTMRIAFRIFACHLSWRRSRTFKPEPAIHTGAGHSNRSRTFKPAPQHR